MGLIRKPGGVFMGFGASTRRRFLTGLFIGFLFEKRLWSLMNGKIYRFSRTS